MWAWVSPILDPTQTQYVDPDDPSLIQIKAPQRSASCLLSKIVPDKDDLNFGYDAHSGDYKDMVAAGILDPIKVVRVALQDAASVAGLLITTDAMVADRPEPKGAPARARCGRHQSAPLARGFRQTLYGAFPVKRLFWVLLTVLCSERERPFFVPPPAIRFPERAEGVKGPKR